MSKPFELTWHPLIDCGSPCRCEMYLLPDDSQVPLWDAEAKSQDKRLTATELAAELFRQTSWLGAIGRAHATGEGRNIVIEAAFTFGPITREEHEWLTLSRFATLPHYDEVLA